MGDLNAKTPACLCPLGSTVGCMKISETLNLYKIGEARLLYLSIAVVTKKSVDSVRDQILPCPIDRLSPQCSATARLCDYIQPIFPFLLLE